MFKIQDGREQFYQWDIDRKLIVSDPGITQVHFCNRTDDCSLVVEVKDGLADVPNILLQDDWKINVYAYDEKYTKHCQTFNVVKRTKPSDYVYTETEVKSYAALDNRLTEVEELTAAANEVLKDTVKEVAANVEQLEALSVAIGEKADKEKWITIADTTLTEDVASLEFTTDINGNPFECKRVIFWCYKPNGLQNTESWLLWFPTVETSSQLGKGYRGNYYVPKNSYGFLLDSTIVKENELIHHWAMGYSAGNLGTPQEILKYTTDATYFTKYGIYPQQHMSQFYSFVKGTKIKVWGLKA